MNRSSEAFDSDSVGSISIAPWTTSGKYMVIGWKPSSIIALAKSSVVTPVPSRKASSNSTSCMQARSPKGWLIRSREAGADVVGVEHGVLRRLAHAVGAVGEHVGHARGRTCPSGRGRRSCGRRAARLRRHRGRVSMNSAPSRSGGRRAPARRARASPRRPPGRRPGRRRHAGVEKVLCRLMCMASTPRSPGFTLPTMALKLAPSA